MLWHGSPLLGCCVLMLTSALRQHSLHSSCHLLVTQFQTWPAKGLPLLRLRGGVIDYSKFSALECSDTPPSSSVDENDFLDPSMHAASCRLREMQDQNESSTETVADSTHSSQAGTSNASMAVDSHPQEPIGANSPAAETSVQKDIQAAPNKTRLASEALQHAPKRRPHFEKGRKVYEWEQSFDEVNIFFTLPPQIKSDDLEVTVEPWRVSVGVKGRRPYLNASLCYAVRRVPESVWMVEGHVLQLSLVKAVTGETWERAFDGHDRMSVADERAVEGDITLEKCRRDHPALFINKDADCTTNMDVDELLYREGASPQDVDMARRYLAEHYRD